MSQKLSAFCYDFSRWPLVTVHIRRACDESDVWAFYRNLETYMVRNERFYIIAVVDNNGPTGTAHSRVGNHWMQTHGAEANRLMIGNTIVLTNPIMRALTKAYLLYNKVPSDKYLFASSLAAAIQNATEAFAREGIALPPASDDRSEGHAAI